VISPQADITSKVPVEKQVFLLPFVALDLQLYGSTPLSCSRFPLRRKTFWVKFPPPTFPMAETLQESLLLNFFG